MAAWRRAHPDSRRHRRGARARGAARGAAGPARHAVARRPHRATPALPDCAVRVGGFGGAEGLARWLRRTSVARAGRRDASLRARASRPTPRARRRRRRRAARRPRPAALGAGARRPLDPRSPTWPRPPRALGAAPRRVFLADRPAGGRGVPRRAAAPLPRAQHRAGRDPATCRPTPRPSSPAGPSPRPTSARCSTRTRIEVVVAKNSGGDGDLRQDRRGARARPAGGHGRPARRPARRRRPSRRRWRGSIISPPRRRSAACRPAAAAPARATTRVAAEPTMTQVAMSAMPASRLGERHHRDPLVGAGRRRGRRPPPSPAAASRAAPRRRGRAARAARG